MKEKKCILDKKIYSYLESKKKSTLPILFLHGWGFSSYTFLPMLELLEKNYHIISLDLPGFGKSSAYKEYSYELFADRVVKFLNKNNFKKVNLLGQSMGGWTVLDFAMNHPERTLSLVLSNSLGGAYSDPERDG